MAHAYLRAGNDVEVYQRCTKVAFPSRQMAMLTMRKQSRDSVRNVQIGKGKLNVYRCPICREWHIGHR